MLGPILFLVFINPLALAILSATNNQCYPSLFADDLALIPNPKDLTLGNCSTLLDHSHILKMALLECDKWATTFKMEFNLKKSNIVVFRKRNVPTTYQYNKYKNTTALAFSLNTGDLSIVSNYTYLGLVFHCHLIWNLHFQHVLTKARRAMGAVSFCATSSSHFSVIRTLVLLIVKPVIEYGLQFWQPTNCQYKQLNTCIVNPLRKAMALPLSTHVLTVLHESAIPSVQLLRQHSILAYTHKCLTSINPHIGFNLAHTLSKQCTSESNLTALITKGSKQALIDSPLVFHQAVVLSSSQFRILNFNLDTSTLVHNHWPISIDSLSKPDARLLLDKLLYFLSNKQWCTDGSGGATLRAEFLCLHPEFKSIPPSHIPTLSMEEIINNPTLFKAISKPNPSLLLDLPEHTHLRSRLKFNRAKFRHLVHTKYNDPHTDPLCQHCNTLADETPEHVLLDCQYYSTPRSNLMKALRVLTPTSLLFISLSHIFTPSFLHSYLLLPNTSLSIIHRLLGNFLSEIHSLNPF